MADEPAQSTDQGPQYSRLEARIDELEMRLAFQDDLMAALNDQIANQEQALQRLWDLNRLLREQVNSVQEPQTRDLSEETPPPHY